MRCKAATLSLSAGGEAGPACFGVSATLGATTGAADAGKAFVATLGGAETRLASATCTLDGFAGAWAETALGALFAGAGIGSARTSSTGLGGGVVGGEPKRVSLRSVRRSLSGSSSTGGRLGTGEGLGERIGTSAAVGGGMTCRLGRNARTALTIRTASAVAARPAVRPAGGRTERGGSPIHRQMSESRRSSSYLARLARSRSTEYAAVIACARL